jgi:hypothetical protein
LDFLDRRARAALVAINPSDLIGRMIGDQPSASCGPEFTCSCTSGTCGGPTCSGATCEVTCSGNSCGETCHGSCGRTA